MLAVVGFVGGFVGGGQHSPHQPAVGSGAGERYRGFKCPHCKLFVPYERAEERDLLEPAG